MKSIQTKFITLILSCVLLSSLVIGGAGVRIAHTVVDRDSAQIMNLLCSEKASELDGLFSRIEQSVKTLALYTSEQLESLERLKTDPDYMNAYTSQLMSVAVNAADNTEGALAVYVRFNPKFSPPTSGLFWSRTTRNGNFEELTPTDFSTYSPSDTEHVGWYYVPVNNGAATWMDPYYNQNIDVEMVSYVIPIYRDNETVGVVGMDIDFSIIEDVVSGIRVYDSGYAFLVDTQGMVVSHREIPMGTPMGNADKSLIPVVSELENGTTGSSLFSYVWRGQDKELSFRTLRNSMHLAVSAPVSEIDSARNRLILHILTALVLISALSVLLTVIFTRRLVRPLKELNAAAKKIAEGDLSVTISHQTRDEVGTLADSFQKTVDSLQKYITYINGLAYRDPLTGVKNKTAYLEAERLMEERMRTGRPEFAVVVMDINGLKEVNDTCGHDFGDILIIDACKLICRTFKRSPVYRIGGDEFVIILENADLAHYPELLEEFARGMAGCCGGRPGESLSIARGIAIYDSQTDLVFANVFKRADDAMYQNKAAMKARAVSKKEDAAPSSPADGVKPL
ncbi:diguanylate cyclase [Oscillibacter sp. MSJ-2]|uniref:Diguanylate cyclase n=1 Tax=Dysosmobacter acutus TaxID=2841504 RepID=A0ABS6F794_9FIRM|nr:diguanylate cyclase [Dysosmobacter acutus]MBU5625477.1 diguanylate cyclase [Dysosmobacter acutus]